MSWFKKRNEKKEKMSVEDTIAKLASALNIVRSDQDELKSQLEQLAELVIRNSRKTVKMTENDMLVVVNGEEYIVENKYSEWVKKQMNDLVLLRKKAIEMSKKDAQ